MDDFIERDRTISIAIALAFHVILFVIVAVVQGGGRPQPLKQPPHTGGQLGGMAPAAVVAHEVARSECAYERVRGIATSFQLAFKKGPISNACPDVLEVSQPITGAREDLVLRVMGPGTDYHAVQVRQSTGSTVADSLILQAVVASGLLSRARGALVLTVARP